MVESPSSQPTDPNLVDMGQLAPQTCLLLEQGTLGVEDVASSEVVMNARGVVTAMVQGHNWVPIPRAEYAVNVGT